MNKIRLCLNMDCDDKIPKLPATQPSLNYWQCCPNVVWSSQLPTWRLVAATHDP